MLRLGERKEITLEGQNGSSERLFASTAAHFDGVRKGLSDTVR
jgi:hypothetical protein